MGPTGWHVGPTTILEKPPWKPAKGVLCPVLEVEGGKIFGFVVQGGNPDSLTSSGGNLDLFLIFIFIKRKNSSFLSL